MGLAGLGYSSSAWGCRAPPASFLRRGGLGMLLLPARGLGVSGSSCAAANNEENNKTFREMFSR